MKKYNQFINEARVISKTQGDKLPSWFHKNLDLHFAILYTDTNIEKVEKAFKEIEKYFEMPQHIKDKLKYESTWWIHIYESWGNSMIPRMSINFDGDYTTNLITLDDFLNVGLDGIEAYFEAKKYNL